MAITDTIPWPRKSKSRRFRSRGHELRLVEFVKSLVSKKSWDPYSTPDHRARKSIPCQHNILLSETNEKKIPAFSKLPRAFSKRENIMTGKDNRERLSRWWLPLTTGYLKFRSPPPPPPPREKVSQGQRFEQRPAGQQVAFS